MIIVNNSYLNEYTCIMIWCDISANSRVRNSIKTPAVERLGTYELMSNKKNELFNHENYNQ